MNRFDRFFHRITEPKIPRKTDWTVIFVNVGLWGMAIFLTMPYIISVIKDLI